jgi:hypothetical protein
VGASAGWSILILWAEVADAMILTRARQGGHSHTSPLTDGANRHFHGFRGVLPLVLRRGVAVGIALRMN